MTAHGTLTIISLRTLHNVIPQKISQIHPIEIFIMKSHRTLHNQEFEVESAVIMIIAIL
jgi:hypothetical protein